ncbi:FtsX-like permease family protein [Flavobacterium sp. AJR]|uniref:ABC transporter permease n=2 Tax=unclassified Flavobacterium TaxID=196869 RepID=UPI000A3D6CAD|nr:ABC transporter permease [Flavobacterium sp. AJR]OUL61993.1 ABC transporter permease [Flavobacterium sp. AJR]
MNSIIKIAWKFIHFDKTKSIGVVVGIVISTFLIGQQIGTFNFLTGLMSVLVKNTTSDIWVVDNKTTDANQLSLIDSRKEKEIKSLPGVKEAFPIVMTNGKAKFSGGTSAVVNIIGSEYPYFKAGPDSTKIIEGKLPDLLQEAGVSADYFDRSNFGGSSNVGTYFEINGKRAVIMLQTKGIRGWGGYLMYTSIDRARYYGNISSTNISALMVNVKEGEDVNHVVNQINNSIYGVRAWRTSSLSSSTIKSVLASTGLGASTGSLVGFAIIAGFFIIGLTMYSSALDRIKDYGTLKAIGATDSYIRKLILTQATLFAVVGFLIALVFLMGFKKGMYQSGIVIDFSPIILFSILMVTFSISLFGAVFAIRRIKNVEPASVFRG